MASASSWPEWWSGGVTECWSGALDVPSKTLAIGCWILYRRDKSLVAGQTKDDQLPAGCGISFEFKPSLFSAREWRRRADYPNLHQQPRGRSS
jgi:hypothetical protein